MRLNILLLLIILLGSLYHMSFFHLNEVLKVADSFAYLQMSHYIGELSQKGLGTGWFGFVYSLPVALMSLIVANSFFAAKLINIILFAVTSILLWKLSRKILSKNYSYLVIILFYLSPTLLHFNIHVLSENIYIPLFLMLFLVIVNFIKKLSYYHNCYTDGNNKVITTKEYNTTTSSYVITIACLIGLMYLTRAEAFIYILSIGIISTTLLVKKILSIKDFFKLGAIFFLSFFLFISPYIYHLHTLTGEWGLTNKGASNLRQAELRGQERMDDAGFEQAVAELTPDNSQLIAGFAGGMNYVRPQIEGSLGEFIAKDPKAFIARVSTNWQKLFSKNLPEVFLGKAPKLYSSDDARFSHIFFLVWCLIPFLILIFGLYKLYKEQRVFFGVSISFFIPALIFFTLFFTLNRYFLIFTPLILIAFAYGVKSISENIMGKSFIKYLLAGNIVSIFMLGTSVYYNIESPKDEYYLLKQEAGEWLNEGKNDFSYDTKIMERFPIVTYYAGSRNRYITPYTDDIEDIYDYGIQNDIDILVVDTMDFETYRPNLKKYLSETPKGFTKIQEFVNSDEQKVILYELKK